MPVHLNDLWLDLVRQAPDAPALIESGMGRSWTRAEISAAAATWRAALPTEAQLAGQVVIFSAPNSAAWFAVFLGLMAAGAIPAALDAQEPEEAQRVAAIAVGAKWLWRDGRLIKVGPARAALSPLRPRAPSPTPRPLAPATRDARSSDGGVCLLKLTSGSTGTPKAFSFTHAQMLADGRQICATMDLRASDRNLAIIPFGHSYGLGNLVVPLLAQGTAVICVASPLPQAIAADCARWHPTVFPAVPALLRALAASDIAPAALSSLRVVISAGAPLDASVAAAFAEKFGRRVHGFYGSSETGGICYDRSGDATLIGRSVGSPLSGVTLRFRAGHRFTVASAAVMGRGDHSPADRGELNSAGELVLLGRTGRGVKIAGRRLDLGEVEAALRAVPGVRDAYVQVHAERPDALAAIIATSLSSAEVKVRVAERLAAWKIPARLIAIPEFPVTVRGKIDHRALRAALERK
jgi:long-chain acyl-CoA synthetase